MLHLLDRHIKFWHMCLANGAALAWFAGMNLSIHVALPGARLFRCPIGLCLGYAVGALGQLIWQKFSG